MARQSNFIVYIIAIIAIYLAHKQGIFDLNELWNSITGGTTTPPPGGGTTPPPSGGGSTPAGTVLYDSTENGWSDVTTAASGSPSFEAGSDGVGRLSAGAGHGRIYIGVPNYNAVMTGTFMFESGFTGRDNLSLRLRSRHQEGGACDNRFGGFGASIHINGEVGFETELCHNEHENSIDGELLSPPPVEGQWYNFAFYCVDSADKTSVNFKMEIDGQVVHTGSHTSPQAYYLDEAGIMAQSYVWLRMNNSQDATLAFKDFKVISQEPGSLDGQTSASRVRAYPSKRYKDNYYLYNKGPAGIYT